MTSDSAFSHDAMNAALAVYGHCQHLGFDQETCLRWAFKIAISMAHAPDSSILASMPADQAGRSPDATLQTSDEEGSGPASLVLGPSDLLTDPAAVHMNMLRGHIAKPSPHAIWHLYGKALLEACPPAWRHADGS